MMATELPVAGAFHSSYMASARKTLEVMGISSSKMSRWNNNNSDIVDSF
jgi:hypothetical protein